MEFRPLGVAVIAEGEIRMPPKNMAETIRAEERSQRRLAAKVPRSRFIYPTFTEMRVRVKSRSSWTGVGARGLPGSGGEPADPRSNAN